MPAWNSCMLNIDVSDMHLGNLMTICSDCKAIHDHDSG